MARKPTDMVQLKVRLPEMLRWHMEYAAKQNDRSMNAEIVARLNRSLQRDEDKIEDVAEALIAGLDRAIVDKVVEIFTRDRVADLEAEFPSEERQTEEGSK